MTLKRGKIPSEKQITAIRELTRDDLELLKEKRQLPVVTRLRDPHHALARFLAAGVRQQDAAARAGYSFNRAHQLMQDPAFQELVQSYRKEVTAQFLESIDDYTQLAVGNMHKAERMIAEKLEAADEEGETLPTRDLIAISRDAADRFGYGKKQTNLNVNVDFAAKLESAIRRSGKTIEARALPVPQSPVLPNTPAPVGSADSPGSVSPQSIRRRA